MLLIIYIGRSFVTLTFVSLATLTVSLEICKVFHQEPSDYFRTRWIRDPKTQFKTFRMHKTWFYLQACLFFSIPYICDRQRFWKILVLHFCSKNKNKAQCVYNVHATLFVEDISDKIEPLFCLDISENKSCILEFFTYGVEELSTNSLLVLYISKSCFPSRAHILAGVCATGHVSIQK